MPPAAGRPADARSDEEPVPPEDIPSKGPSKGLNRPIEWTRIWRGKGLRGWDPDKTWQEQEILNEGEVRMVSVLIAETSWERPTVEGRPVAYLACKARMSLRYAHRVLDVLCDPKKAGLFKRKKGRVGEGGAGRYDVNGYEPLPAGFATLADLQERPMHWDHIARGTRSDSALGAYGAPGTVHQDAVKAAAVGLPADDAKVAQWILAAQRADNGAWRLARSEANASARQAAFDKRALEQKRLEAELAAALAELAARPRPAPPPGLPPVPAVATAPATGMCSLEEAATRHPDPENLLSVVARWSDAGYPWAVGALNNILLNGGRITDPQKETARKLLEREQRGEPPNAGGGRGGQRGGAASTQRLGGYRPKGSR